MVRGYFHAFFSGQGEVLYPGKKRLEAKEYKRIVVDNFENFSSNFVTVLFGITFLVRLPQKFCYVMPVETKSSMNW